MRHLTRWVGMLMLVLLLAPLGWAVRMSFTPKEVLGPTPSGWSLRWYREFFASPLWRAALWNSFEVALWSVTASVLGGVCLALAVARYHFRGRQLLAGAVLLPLFVPSVVVGMGLLPLLHALGLWGVKPALALAHSLGSLPIVFLLARSALEAVNPDLEAAARGLGATPWRTFRHVTWPLIRPAIVTGAVVSFFVSLNEFPLALFLARPESETLPRVVWPRLRDTLSPVAAVASCVTMVLIGVVVVLAMKRSRRWGGDPGE